MTSTTEGQRVDIGALAASLYNETAERLAMSVVDTIDHLADDGNPLNQIQKFALVQGALDAAGGLQALFAEDLKVTLEKEGVTTWGLGADLERLLAGRA